VSQRRLGRGVWVWSVVGVDRGWKGEIEALANDVRWRGRARNEELCGCEKKPVAGRVKLLMR